MVGKGDNSGDEEEFIGGMELCFAHHLVASIELGLFGIIAKLCSAAAGNSSQGAAFASSSDIASHLGTKNPNAPNVLDQMLRLLATRSLLTSSSRTLEDGRVEIVYAITPLSRVFVQNEDGVSLARFAGLIKHQDPHVKHMCSRMKEAVFEVDPESPCLKEEQYQTLAENEMFAFDFNKSMSDISNFIVKGILKHSNAFDGVKSLVDVGGGDGTTLNMILTKYPSIYGVNFDLPSVLETATTPLYNVGGDMFEKVPTGDAILLKTVLHNWSDEKCLAILKNCYLALPEYGKVIVVEILLPKMPGTTSLDKYASLMDNLMLCQQRAKERTEFEFKILAKGAGFTKFEVQYCGCGHFIMELYK